MALSWSKLYCTGGLLRLISQRRCTLLLLLAPTADAPPSPRPSPSTGASPARRRAEGKRRKRRRRKGDKEEFCRRDGKCWRNRCKLAWGICEAEAWKEDIAVKL
eukprot:564952-Rhodomonas_salina.1